MSGALLGSWLTETVTVTRWTGFDSSSQPTYAATPETLKARINRRFRRVVDARGQEVTSSVEVGTAERIWPLDRIQIPGETASRTPISVAYSEHPDTGETLSVAYL
jgi:hypothetical protein